VSDTYLILCAKDPQAQIDETNAESACDALEKLFPDADEVSYDLFDEVRFIDPGQTFDKVTCPACGKDAEPWWSHAMDTAAKSEFEDLIATAKCCGARVSLNDLIYEPNAGFGRFALVVMNAGVEGISSGQQHELELLLRQKLQVVAQRI
jgi:hypothetical protein